MTTLLMSSRHTEDNQALWRAAIARGWEVVRAQGIRLPEIDDAEVVIYVESLFAPTIAKTLGRTLLDLPEDWLVRLPLEFRKREIKLTTLQAARSFVEPAFVKPPNDKSFAAQVYPSGHHLPDAYADDMTVLVSQPVEWEAEYRCFCLDGKVRAFSPYLRGDVLANQTNFAFTETEKHDVKLLVETVLNATQEFTPRAVVVDVGPIKQRGWGVVEANAAWGSGVYGCDPDAVLDVLRCATLQPGAPK